MKISKLHINDFKNLKNFDVDFDETSNRQVVVGRNAVGKSNLFEAIIRIFRDIDLNSYEMTDFEYEIEYHCRGYEVKILNELINKNEYFKDSSTLPKYKRRYFIISQENDQSEQKEANYKEIKKAEAKDTITGKIISLIPSYVFGYYSGISTRLSGIFQKHELDYFKKQVFGKEEPLRTLFLAKPHHSQFALLAFFASEDENAKKFLNKEFGITGIDSVLFSLRQPYWDKGKVSKEKIKLGDSHFWYAGGKVALFLERLFKYSFAPMSGTERIEVDLGQNITKERRYCFISNQKKLQAIAQGLSSKEFFARMESLYFSDLIDPSGVDVQLNINIEGSKEPITFMELSEGERQLITVIGLMRFTAEKEALFILDEPDTHQNPAWCLDYLQNLKDYGVEPPNSQIILSTHSPLTFAGLEKNEVVILEKCENQITSHHPITSPRGMGFDAILTSDFFGMRSTLDRVTLEKLDKMRMLSYKNEKTEEEINEYMELSKELDGLDFSSSVADPMYKEFVQSMSKIQSKEKDISESVPTMEAWKKRKKIAEDIAKRLKEEHDEVH
jgi:predicted ATP-binding protein involved in virulence